MSIDISAIQSMYSSGGIGSVASSGGQTGGASALGVTGAYAVNVSQPGQLLSQLQSLAQSDPAKFKTVTADIAAQLKDAASSRTGRQADVLNDLAGRFQSASKSGNPSDLTPRASQTGPQGAGHHHHHHHAQVASGNTPGAAGQTHQDSVWQTVQSIIDSALNSTG